MPLSMPTPIVCDMQTPVRETPLQETKGQVLILGNFDGLHRGHQALIEQALQDSESDDKRRVYLLTFTPHPRQYFGDDTPFQLQNNYQKTAVTRDMGVDGVVELPFAQVAHLTAEHFMDDVLVGLFGVSHVVVGYDFHFGAKRAGTVSHLQQHTGFTTTVVDEITVHGECSSTVVRGAIAEGDMTLATQLLGRPYQVMGQVVHGQKLGRTIGFPTLNIDMTDYQRPKYGVYRVRVNIDNTWYDAIANLGMRPTVDGLGEKLEIHVFEFNRDIYGITVLVDFMDFIRAEQKFEDLESLQAQIGQDIVTVKNLLL